MEIGQLRFLCKDETIQMTDHVYKKSRQRNIKFDDIKRCIMYGQIIEDYPNDFPFPSALILECSVGKPIHVVAGVGDGLLWIITAYFPDEEKWENDYKTRKEHKL